MSAAETPLCFDCAGDRLVGIVHTPAMPKARGVVIVVGGPQYRIGSHRQFVSLARFLAAAGYPVLRFDYRGLGDSDGDFVGFRGIDADISSAVDAFRSHLPDLEHIVLWGLCDAASAIAYYAHQDRRIDAIALLNPWVRSEAGLARTHARHYYLQRLLDRDFWARLARGRIDLRDSLRSLIAAAAAVGGGLAPRGLAPGGRGATTDRPADTGTDDRWSRPLPDTVGRALRRFDRASLIILSGDDLTANEFHETVLKAKPLRGWARRDTVTVQRLAAANHTYASRQWRQQVHRWTLDWLGHLPPAG